MHDMSLFKRVLPHLVHDANPTVPRPQGHPGLSLVDCIYRGLLQPSVGILPEIRSPVLMSIARSCAAINAGGCGPSHAKIAVTH